MKRHKILFSVGAIVALIASLGLLSNQYKAKIVSELHVGQEAWIKNFAIKGYVVERGWDFGYKYRLRYVDNIGKIHHIWLRGFEIQPVVEEK